MEETKTGIDSIWIEKNSKGYTFGVKVYMTKEDTIESLRERLKGHIDYLNANYNSTPTA